MALNEPQGVTKIKIHHCPLKGLTEPTLSVTNTEPHCIVYT